MRVAAWKTVDVECEVDVDLSHCINEMLGIANEEGMPSRKLSAIDGATRILDTIKPEMVMDKLTKNPKTIELIRLRIQDWIDAVQEKRDG